MIKPGGDVRRNDVDGATLVDGGGGVVVAEPGGSVAQQFAGRERDWSRLKLNI